MDTSIPEHIRQAFNNHFQGTRPTIRLVTPGNDSMEHTEETVSQELTPTQHLTILQSNTIANSQSEPRTYSEFRETGIPIATGSNNGNNIQSSNGGISEIPLQPSDQITPRSSRSASARTTKSQSNARANHSGHNTPQGDYINIPIINVTPSEHRNQSRSEEPSSSSEDSNINRTLDLFILNVDAFYELHNVRYNVESSVQHIAVDFEYDQNVHTFRIWYRPPINQEQEQETY